MPENRMGVESVPRLIVKMSLPMMMSMFAMAMYNVVDSVFVAMLSEDAFTAVSLAFPFQMLIAAVAVGTGAGISSLVARRLGNQDQEGANAAAANGQFLALISAALFTLMFLIFTPFFVSLFDPEPGIARLTAAYLFICGGFSSFSILDIMTRKTLQGTGDTFRSMLIQLVGVILNVIFDPLLIFGYLGFPKLGVQGAAIATVGGQFASMALAFYFMYRRKNTLLRISLKGFKPSFKVIRDIYAVGLPSVIMQAIGSVTTFGLNKILIMFSGTAVNVLGAYFKLQSFVFMPVFGLSSGALPIMGYNFGAKNKKRFMDTLKWSTAYAFLIMLTGLLIFYLFPAFLLSFFSPSEDMLHLGSLALRAISLSFPMAACGIIFSTVFQAIGKGLLSLMISICRQIVLILPIAYLLASTTGLSGVWYAYPIAEFGTCIISVVLLVRMYHRRIRDLDKEPVAP